EENNRHLETWRLRRRLAFIESLKPTANTSVFTILIRPDDQITKIRSMLGDELSKSSNIKSDINRLSVQEGLKAITEHLKSYRRLPDHGLACYSGTSVVDPDTEKIIRFRMFFEPPKPIPRFIYDCGKCFHTETLRGLLQDDTVVGYIVIDGKGAMFVTVRGNCKEVHHKMAVDLPRKHTRGGQSAARFARIREDARKIYISQVCEKASQVFIKNNMPVVSHIVIAGQAHLKDCLEKSTHFDGRLRPLICSVLTVDYGGGVGLNEAIRQSSDKLTNIRLGQEIALIESFLNLLYRGQDDHVAYGAVEVVKALEEGAVHTIIAWQDLDVVRWTLVEDDATSVVEYLGRVEEPHPERGLRVDRVPLVEWLVDHACSYGSKLELVSDQTPEGTMLVEGFHGLVALLRYARPSPPDPIDPS
ncbi:Peptide chain release factor eRF1/aRF1, partial [Trinorchestia longiramus]